MQVDYIIVGQGICGTYLSWEFQKANQSFIVIDESNPFSASKVASGIINPVTGRRIVKTWMIDELMPFAWNAYQAIGSALNINCISEKDIIDCFATPQMRLAFIERFEQDKQFLDLPANENDWLEHVQYDFGYGIIHPCYLVDLQLLLSSHQKKLKENNTLIRERFETERMIVKDESIHYKDITAGKIIFCDGVAGFDNPFFKNLPYGANKGEVVLVEIPDLPATHIIKRGYSLVPWAANIFWLGSTYLWEFEDILPTKGFYNFADNWLKQTIKAPFKIVDHMAAARPATLERRPFVGFHPVYKNIGILNGMGTKGCSLAPYFAKQLVNHLLSGSPVLPDADVQRFKKVLSR
jgi:glycine/D-amino acid oxidase-like deaminating enzyme